jgi:hypothetical protein
LVVSLHFSSFEFVMRFSIIAAFIFPLAALARPLDLVNEVRAVAQIDPAKQLDAFVTNAVAQLSFVSDKLKGHAHVVKLANEASQELERAPTAGGQSCVNSPDSFAAHATSSK